MPYRILCFTRRAADPWLEAAERYLHRLRRVSNVQLIALKESGKSQQHRALNAKLKGSRAKLVALDESGVAMSSQKLARWLEQVQQEHRDVDFVLGGADGLERELLQRADLVLSLSKMTLPHRAALAVLAEQLYRCDSMIRGTPYHRE